MRSRLIPALAVPVLAVACSDQPTAIDDGPLLRSEAAPEIREVPPFPFFGRTFPVLCCVDGYAAYYFYVADPSVIPDDFNLPTFIDPRALAVDEWAVEGFVIRDLPMPFSPKKSHLKGKGAVPFWFVTEDLLAAALADGFLNMPELESLNPIKGYAGRFLEEFHPDFGSPTQVILITSAAGALVDGGTFRFNANVHLNKNTGAFTSNVKGSLTMD